MNMFPQREQFVGYEQKQRVDLISRKTTPLASQQQASATDESFAARAIVIDENYIGKRSQGSSSAESEVESSFELIANKDPLQTDRQLIQDQLHKLLKSTPITIEEKGQLIHLMHQP